MKRLIAMLAAAAMLGGPLAVGGSALAKDRDEQGQARREEPRGAEGRQVREAPQREPQQREPAPRESRAYPAPREAYPPQQAYPREERRAYAPPPVYAPQPYAREEAPSARRGGYLPPAAGAGIVQDLSRYRLRLPPRGYVWVRVNGGFALVSQGTGQIFDIVPY